MNTPTDHPLEMWGGIECTVNRVRDEYFDQMARNGHSSHVRDLELIAGLGIKSIRYPALWEHVAPEENGVPDWSFPDERLPRLRDLGVNPIVGLTHHGSGPRYTSLADPQFPEKLARYARACAERFPWVNDYTPVNEPLTTARFSGLYGHWYPHGKDTRTFMRTLLNQCRGICLAMAAIREVNPQARLIQTEDLGRIYSTPELAHLAELYNHRRWLSLDLLCGRVNREHALWSLLLEWGASEEELLWFGQHPCPPNIMGINHYLTSDRYLDPKQDCYPASRAVTDEGICYADVEAVRADLDVPVGTCSALREAWNRYHLPLAVTEAHLCGTREEQIRWLYEVWDGARRLRRRGIDVRAVTAWSLFGAFDWNILVTREEGFYEPGVFDVRAPKPRPTALARLVRDLAATGEAGDEPLLHLPGWWRRVDRLFQPTGEGRSFDQGNTLPISSMRDRSLQPLLILGATGTLGSAFVRLCDARGIPYHLVSRRYLDLTKGIDIDAILDETNVWAVVNAAGYVKVDEAEDEPELCQQLNTVAPVAIAQACGRHGIPFLAFSSDLVFDGKQPHPYTESSAPAPLNLYGRSKADMEKGVLDGAPKALVIRTSAFFGPWDEANFVTRTLASLAEGQIVKAPRDQTVSPTYVPDLVHAALDLLVDRETGIWHLANVGAITWSDLAQLAAGMASLPAQKVAACSSSELGSRAPRPAFSALASEKAYLMPSLEDALARYLLDRKDPERFRKAA